MKQYTVSNGWIEYRKVGSFIEERYSDNPSCDTFDTFEDALNAYRDIDIKEQYETERMCAGRTWRERDAYKSIDEYDLIDDNGYSYADNLNGIMLEKYGMDNRHE